MDPAEPPFDLHDPAQRADPHRALDHLRHRCPVAFVREPAPYYALSRYQDVVSSLRETAAWSSRAGPGLSYDPVPSPNILVNSDPPRHTLERRVLSALFRPTVTAGLAPVIDAVTARLLDAFAPRGSGDIMASVINPVPLEVVSSMVGVVDVDLEALRRWVVVLSESVGYPRSLMPRRIAAAAGEFTEWCLDQIARRKATPSPPDDILQTLLTCELDGNPLTDAQIVSFLQFVLVAGTGTTSLLIGNLLYRLMQHPDQMALVAGQPEAVDAAIEESLRFDSPALGLFRTNERPISLHGVEIPTGSKTIILFGSANRDPEVFADPDRFDIAREPAELRRHVAFGHGIHLCLGAPLARLEAKVVVSAIVNRLRGLEIDGVPTRVPSVVLTGFDTLPVRWRTDASPAPRSDDPVSQVSA